MNIKYLKINNFGKIKNKEINLNNNINLIYGKNESGKTTLLKFIVSMLYGISKNKNGREISDLERYMPWQGEEFSGKLTYELDNKNNYEIFREFKKKNPKIYNDKLEDISNEYSIDKNKGNQFFYEQTKIDEELFLSTTIVEQQGVVLNENSQNTLTQKITNILSSGNDNVSYDKTMENLSKKMLEEVGTERTIGRPLNNITNEINIIENEINLLEEFKSKNLNLKEEKNKIKEEINNLENKLNLIKSIKEIKEKENIEKEKIKINNNIKEEYKEKIINLNNKINNQLNNKINNKNIKNNKLNISNILLLIILIILNILINIKIFNFSKILGNIIISSTIIYLIINLVLFIFNRKKLTKLNNKLKNETNIENIKIENELNILEENKNNKEKEIKEIQNQLLIQNETNFKLIKDRFINKIDENEINSLFNKELQEINIEINLISNNLNNKRIELNTLEIQEININEKLENYSSYKERLQYLYTEKDNVLSLAKSITLAKEALEIAYKKMKNEITPKFTKDLSKLIEKISNGKYKKVNFNNEDGLTVELENGEYINANRLSIGTIDQLYLSLRLSSMQEITNEKMPIILDETFAYYDEERLENIFKYINENYKENQIIIFTCSNRERNIFDKLDITYNLIEI